MLSYVIRLLQILRGPAPLLFQLFNDCYYYYYKYYGALHLLHLPDTFFNYKYYGALHLIHLPDIFFHKYYGAAQLRYT
jgi:hypothetical protein